MARAYVNIAYIQTEDGRKEFGDEIELARTTDTEKANFQRLIDYGVISVTKPQQPSREDDEDHSEQ